jgi:hypothetical protein
MPVVDMIKLPDSYNFENEHIKWQQIILLVIIISVFSFN